MFYHLPSTYVPHVSILVLIPGCVCIYIVIPLRFVYGSFLDAFLAFQQIMAKPLRISFYRIWITWMGLFYRTSQLVFNVFYHHLKDGNHLVLSGVVRRALLRKFTLECQGSRVFFRLSQVFAFRVSGQCRKLAQDYRWFKETCIKYYGQWYVRTMGIWQKDYAYEKKSSIDF